MDSSAPAAESAPAARDRPRRWPRRLAIALAILLLAVIALHAWASPPQPDTFYSSVEGAKPRGTIVRHADTTTGIPAGAKGVKLLYHTVDARGDPTVASALLLLPPGDKAAPAVIWTHGTTGIVAGCAPSLSATPFHGAPAIDMALKQGWAIVAPDYAGLGTGGGHAYLVGEVAALQSFDAYTAAKAAFPDRFDGRAVAWGHSQGGNTALWMAKLPPPEGANLLGAAALAPASNLEELVRESRASMFGRIVSAYLIKAYATAYPDVKLSDYVGFWPRIVGGDIASRCAGGLETLASVVETKLLPADGLFRRDPTSGPLGERLRQNSPMPPYRTAVMIGQGKTDDLVFPAIQQRFVEAARSASAAIDYREYDGRDHMGVVAPGSPAEADLITWTRERLQLPTSH